MEIRIILTSFALLFSTVECASGAYNVPFEADPWNEARKFKPIDYMVDITNYLGLNVLYEHNFLNDNNIAFSPYGLTGILIALYEGVDGVSSMQIKESLGLPNDRSIMRVGFRDIHRRLRSYFIPKEGFLAGLAFNNENLTFRDDYKNILNFYGYVFDMPKPLTTQPIQTSTERMSTVVNSAITNGPSTEYTNSSQTTERSNATPTDMTIIPVTTSTPVKITTASTMPTASPLNQNSSPENEDESIITTEAPITTTKKLIPISETTTPPTTKPPTTTVTTQEPTTVPSTTIITTTQATTTKPPTTQAPTTLPTTTLPPTTVTVTTQPTTTPATTTTTTTTEATTTTVIPTTKPPTTLASTTVTTTTTLPPPTTTTTLSTTQSTSTVPTTVLTTTENPTTMEATQTASTRVTRSTEAQTTTIKQTTMPLSTNTMAMTKNDDENSLTERELNVQEDVASTVSEKKQSEIIVTTEATQPTTVKMSEVTTKMPTTVQATDPPTTVSSKSEPDILTTEKPTDKPTDAVTDKQESTTELSEQTTKTDESDNISSMTTVTEMDSTTEDQSEYEKTTVISYGSTIAADKPLQRKKKSIFHYDFVSPTYQDHFAFYRPVFLRNPNYEGRGLQHQRSFLANGYSKVQITYMTYDTVLEFAYIPFLKSMALKLPLDTSEYYLLILLPEYEFGVNQLIKDLHSERSPSLKQINYMLTNTYVRAWVPSFMLKGFIVLTSDLQKLGICDAFEPRQDDFKPMTNEKNIYVRNIEQAITVTIRKYMEPSVKKRYVQHRQPVEFAATHPFLFFVMDSAIHVSLMAGKIVNPLNSRIFESKNQYFWQCWKQGFKRRPGCVGQSGQKNINTFLSHSSIVFISFLSSYLNNVK